MSSRSTAGSDTSQLLALKEQLEHLQIEQHQQQPQISLDTTNWTFANMEPRRSARLTVYDSNGRDALAGYLGMTRLQLEALLTSSTVRPHLQTWCRTCVEGERRFNDAIDWINTGDTGYFYNPADLEEDLLLECLGEGSGADGGDDDKSFATENTKTGDWITQDLWARTIWRIVHDNSGPGQIFNRSITAHPAACYGFGVDLLTIAFHSICHRKTGSCWHDLIIGASHCEKDAWTSGRYSWLAQHGKDDAQVDSAKSDPMDLDESESHSELGGVTTITSDSTVADPDNNAPRTMAALRKQRYNIAEAKTEALARSTERGKPLTLGALQEPEHLSNFDSASEANSIAQWRKKVDKEISTPGKFKSGAFMNVRICKKQGKHEDDGRDKGTPECKCRKFDVIGDIDGIAAHGMGNLQLETPNSQGLRRFARRTLDKYKDAAMSPESLVTPEARSRR